MNMLTNIYFRLAAGVALITLPFLNKAAHMDDTVYLYAARQIAHDPWRPFDFQFNWMGLTVDAGLIIINPPLLSYYLAGLTAAFGGHEMIWHAGMIIFPLAAVYAMHALARRFCPRADEAALLLAAAPPFAAAASSLMLDVPAFAGASLGTLFFIRSMDRADGRGLLCSGFFLGLACLFKYWALAQFPALLIYGVMRGQSRRAVGALCWGAALPAAWLLYTWWSSGFFHLALARQHVAQVYDPLAAKAVSLAAGLGGGLLLLDRRLLSRQTALSGGAIIGGAALAALYHRHLPGLSLALLLFFTGNGLLLLLSSLAAGWRAAIGGQDKDSLFLLIWLASGLAFTLGATHFNATRHLLTFLPPLVFLLFQSAGGKPPGRTSFAVNWGGMLLLSLAVAAADYQFANSYRNLARHIFSADSPLAGSARPDGQPAAVWFATHWGMQFYMERAGARFLEDANALAAQTGDWFIGASNAHHHPPPAALAPRLEKRLTYDAVGGVPLRLMHRGAGAGWYADLWGPLPFALEWRAPFETFTLYRVGGEAAHD